jgi:gluconate 2-dehydrogenase gamma chain
MSEPIDRRQALLRLGAPAVVPLLSHFHPSIPPQEGDWKPRFFALSEVPAVIELAERIIPETDTPGARRALVHQYIDFVLSEGAAESREQFREGLVRLDRRSVTLFEKPFARLEAGRQDEMLRRLSESPSGEEPAAVAFFAEAKRLTVDGYYRSEAGMTQELGFEGRTFLAEFKGCTHPEHLAWKVEE